MIRQPGEFRRYFNHNSPPWRITVSPPTHRARVVISGRGGSAMCGTTANQPSWTSRYLADNHENHRVMLDADNHHEPRRVTSGTGNLTKRSSGTTMMPTRNR